ncbi:unnamed protein product [Didymodactylos carnosus]|uniref:Uncharacterized protein n=1 Tax=Didymodactylos carnosus TaxID=1234261 RepID=A0A813PMB0_9BILA|nr:unnamed protein product [Didymodactylos carnosus]CAF0773423.1 unnamed protein product [Didymodactylos carnosus]CAF3537646.1 unnamed protein product [Didymodactylos carnosus]CAF3554446.1 unnamed protein product [Didymodactylos carnosus]
MGSSASNNLNNNETIERFKFKFIDCACKCDARKRKIDNTDQGGTPQAVFMTALMPRIERSQYDLHCDCDCGEGVKLGFLFGNSSSAADNMMTKENQKSTGSSDSSH